VQKLTQMLGRNMKLFDVVLQFLHMLFLWTINVHNALCVLSYSCPCMI
jgi:negative elongation factor B